MGLYNKSGDTIEITIRDNTGRKVEQFKANVQDKKLVKKIFSIIEHKYNLVMDSKQPKEDENWLDMDNEFFK